MILSEMECPHCQAKGDFKKAQVSFFALARPVVCNVCGNRAVMKSDSQYAYLIHGFSLLILFVLVGLDRPNLTIALVVLLLLVSVVFLVRHVKGLRLVKLDAD